jgi:hypothetical protein
MPENSVDSGCVTSGGMCSMLLLKDEQGDYYAVPMDDLKTQYLVSSDDLGGDAEMLVPAGCGVCCKF